MNIEEFFQLSAGKWFSHRTSHHLALKKSDNGKSEVVIEALAADHPEVIKLCQQYKINPNEAACGAKVTWNGTMELSKEKHSGFTLLVSVPDADNPHTGRLLQKMGSGEKIPEVGRYQIGNDGSLSLTTESETISSEERLWFASPNLRMRVSIIKRSDGLSMASFTSEIRMVSSPATPKATEVTNSAN